MNNVSVEGNYPTLTRQRTGLFSLDMALRDGGKIGIPLRTILELYGYPNCGKSTLAYYLSGKITGKGRVSNCDVEFCDREYVATCLQNAGMEGTVKLIDPTDSKGKPRFHEDMLAENARDLYDEEYGASILDSIGLVMPNVEMDVVLNPKEEDLGQAFMGKRAKLIGQYSRALQLALRNKQRPSLGIIISHVHGIMGGHGHTSAGGETKGYAAAVRIMLWPQETYWADEKTKQDPIGFRVSGQIEKLRYGGRGRKFSFYIVPGYGVHEGASALFDCLDYGWADSKTIVKIGERKFGYLRADLLMAAADGNTRRFNAFQEEISLRENELITSLVGSGDGENEDDENNTSD